MPSTYPSDSERHEHFSSLLTKHYDEIFSLILALVPSHPDAKDVMQETALALWRKMDDYDPSRPFANWACQFARMQVKRFWRRGSRRKLVFDNELVDSIAAEHESCSPVLQQRRAALGYCLRKLGEGDRLLLKSRYTKGATVRKLAASMKTPPKKLYYQLERLRNILFECVSRKLDEGWRAS